MKKKKITTCFAALFIGVMAVAQIDKKYDTNHDGKIDKNEFQQTYRYNDWDQNKDGTVDNAEFSQATYRDLDRDQDGNLTTQEWENASKNKYNGALKNTDYH